MLRGSGRQGSDRRQATLALALVRLISIVSLVGRYAHTWSPDCSSSREAGIRLGAIRCVSSPDKPRLHYRQSCVGVPRHPHLDDPGSGSRFQSRRSRRSNPHRQQRTQTSRPPLPLCGPYPGLLTIDGIGCPSGSLKVCAPPTMPFSLSGFDLGLVGFPICAVSNTFALWIVFILAIRHNLVPMTLVVVLVLLPAPQIEGSPCTRRR